MSGCCHSATDGIKFENGVDVLFSEIENFVLSSVVCFEPELVAAFFKYRGCTLK